MQGNLHEDRYTFLIISLIFSYNEMFQVENIKTLMFRNLEICAFRRIILKNNLEPGSPQMTIFRMCIACWTRQATNTHSEYAINAAFLLQHWLHKRTCATLFVRCLSLGRWGERSGRRRIICRYSINLTVLKPNLFTERYELNLCMQCRQILSAVQSIRCLVFFP